MGLGPFSSDSKSTQRHTDRSVAATDQAIVYQPQSSGNVRSSTRLGAGASLVINQGLSREDVGALLAQAQVNPRSEDDSAFKEAVLMSLERRAEANTTRAVDEAQSAAPSNVKKYVLWAVGAVLALALVIVLGGKR
jgi:hypothetical protein